MAQIVDGMSSGEVTGVEAQRFWVRDQYGPHVRGKYDTLEGKLAAPRFGSALCLAE